MSEAGDKLRERIALGDCFTREEIAAYTAVGNDLDLWSAIYTAFGKAYYRIDPEPGMTMTCEFMTRYLLRCVQQNPPSNHVHSGYEAASELAACLKSWLSKLPEAEPVLHRAARQTAAVYIAGDAEVRDRILNGMLEHALELAAVRPFFAYWASDPLLHEPWQLAMEWAVAHGDPAAQ
jgi:hypothetical protein